MLPLISGSSANCWTWNRCVTRSARTSWTSPVAGGPFRPRRLGDTATASYDVFWRLPRADVAEIRRRLAAGEKLPADRQRDPDAYTGEQRVQAADLAQMAATGTVPVPSLAAPEVGPWRRAMAEQLFLTHRDLTPLIVLLIATTERNIETIKELPVQHRILGTTRRSRSS